MLNLLRMDLYRMKRTKSVYICFILFVMVILLSYTMVYLLLSPEGQKTSMKIGMVTVQEVSEGVPSLDGMDSLAMFREGGMDGGMYGLLFGIVVALFVCGDFHGGFMKNIMSLQRERWKYIGSKMAAAGILNFVYLLLGFGVNSLMNVLFGRMVPFAPPAPCLFYLFWMWLISMAFAALIILVCVFTRSTTWGVLTAVFGCSGVAVSFLGTITSYFHLGGWFEYTLYCNMAYGSSAYSGPGDLKVVAVGLVFLILYTAAAAVSLVRQDI